MAIFGNKNASDIFSSLKKTAKESMDKASDSMSKASAEMKKHSEASKEAKAPVEGSLIRYGVIYLGGLPEYPKRQVSEIGFNIMEDSFYFKPTLNADWFEDMVIPYDSITKFEVVTRQLTASEQMLTNDAKSLEQDNNIEITFTNAEDIELVLRIEMLTGITVAGQAVKCREMMDLLRQKGILKKLNKEQNNPVQQVVQVDPLEQLQKLQALKEAGILSEDEFNAKKADLLNKI